MKIKALTYLRTARSDPSADFRDGQWESIEQLLNRNRVLVVQRTGWGKSMVYFLATKLLREQGAGPTLLISPLISLMRNQLESANRIGIRARTINSSNNTEWSDIENEIQHDLVDVLLISPEKLANDNFRNNVLARLAGSVGLFVVDEAHCISDWGHDFRPDYKRISRILDALPSNIPVLATTATANSRVIDDISSQLGKNIQVSRGPLARESLHLQKILIPSPAARMAWISQKVQEINGNGIVYTLTQRDTERLTEWLQINNIEAFSYHSKVLPSEEQIPEISQMFERTKEQFRSLNNKEKCGLYREYLERQLLNNKIKVLVSTVALGMGFDKPDIKFVFHYQIPGSVVSYYQQVGRAGREINNAFGVLLQGDEDEKINSFFAYNAFPSQTDICTVISALISSEHGMSTVDMERELNLSRSRINKIISFVSSESPSPIIKQGKWIATPFAHNYSLNTELINRVTAIREVEQRQMIDYMEHTDCLMAFLQTALDDPSPHSCGKCMNCNPSAVLDETYDDDLANRAGRFLRRSYQPLSPRKRWPAKNMFKQSPLEAYNIPKTLQAQEGRALSLWRDAGWGQLVAHGKYQTNRFSDDLVAACVKMLQEWASDPAPQWVTCIPSLNHPDLVPDFASRLANALELPFVACIEKAQANSQQKYMENSYQQVRNLDGAFKINLEPKEYLPCLLVDDMIDSGWTFTVASALLRQAGCSAVYPMALALNSPRMD